MTYLEFAKTKPTLYGAITVNNTSKIGMFKPEWSRHSGQIDYAYYTFKGNKGKGGFTMMKAYKLFINKQLSINPQDGNPENYL